MAIVVVSIHAQLFKEIDWLYSFFSPLKGSAVPMFFTISSFLFFTKCNKSNGFVSEKSLLYHYLKRMIKFYFFWFIILLPMTIIIRKWYNFDFFKIIRQFLLDSTFRGSYFITALIIGVPIVFFVKRYITLLEFLFISFTVSFIIRSSEMLDFPIVIKDVFEYSFLPNLIWIILGAILASSTAFYQKKKPVIFLLCLLYLALLVHPIINRLLFPAFIVTVFLLFKNLQLKERKIWVLLRKTSILIFVIHFVFYDSYLYFAHRIPVLNNSILFFIVILACAILAAISFLKLSEKPTFKWLKNGL